MAAAVTVVVSVQRTSAAAHLAAFVGVVWVDGEHYPLSFVILGVILTGMC